MLIATNVPSVTNHPAIWSHCNCVSNHRSKSSRHFPVPPFTAKTSFYSICPWKPEEVSGRQKVSLVASDIFDDFELSELIR